MRLVVAIGVQIGSHAVEPEIQIQLFFIEKQLKTECQEF